MKKFIWIAGAALAGAIAAYLFDPDRGRSRRARLSDQAAAKARDAAETLDAKVEYQKGVLKGVAHDAAEKFEPARKLEDETLLQKVKSEAIGPWSASSGGNVEIDIRDGNVRVTGSVASDEEGQRLLDRIRSVEGVEVVEDGLLRSS